MVMLLLKNKSFTSRLIKKKKIIISKKAGK